MVTAEAQICKKSFLHNVAILNSMCGSDCTLVYVLKANGYGHGSIQLARLLPNSSMIAVARLEEALELRMSGITNSILLLEGCFDTSELILAIKNNFQITISSYKQFYELSSIQCQTPLTIWLKVDIGMCRLGIDVCDVEHLIDLIDGSNIKVRNITLFSHFSSADDNVEITFSQFSRFNNLISSAMKKASISNSAAFLSFPSMHLDYVRLGLILYGISPFSNTTASDYNLLPVMRLKSKIISIKNLAQGASVSYGGIWKSNSDTRIATVAMGYADGYPRNIPSETPVWVNNRLVPIIGRVCMDMLIIDLGSSSKDHVGDDVIFWVLSYLSRILQNILIQFLTN